MRRAIAYSLAASLLGMPAAAAQLGVATSRSSVTGGDAFDVSVSLARSASEAVSAVSMDLAFDPQSIASSSCQLTATATAAGKVIQSRMVSPGLLRVGVYGLNATVIPSGPVFTCGLRAVTFAPAGDVALSSSGEGALANGASASVTANSARVAILADGDGDGVTVDGTLARCTGGANTGCSDNCPSVENTLQTDADGDGVGDACDICASDPNPPGEGGAIGEQLDADSDGAGNRCDCDFDQNGTCGNADVDRFATEFGATDSGVGTDMNGDGIVDLADYQILLRALANRR